MRKMFILVLDNPDEWVTEENLHIALRNYFKDDTFKVSEVKDSEKKE